MSCVLQRGFETDFFDYRFWRTSAALGFNDPANLDDGNMWPTSYALTKLTAGDEAKIVEIVKKAVS